jgi:hypothetical protein
MGDRAWRHNDESVQIASHGLLTMEEAKLLWLELGEALGLDGRVHDLLRERDQADARANKPRVLVLGYAFDPASLYGPEVADGTHARRCRDHVYVRPGGLMVAERAKPWWLEIAEALDLADVAVEALFPSPKPEPSIYTVTWKPHEKPLTMTREQLDNAPPLFIPWPRMPRF